MTFHEMVAYVADQFGLTPEHLQERVMRQPLPLVRGVVWSIATEQYGYSVSGWGWHHTSVTHAISTTRQNPLPIVQSLLKKDYSQC